MHDLAISILKNAELEEENEIKKHTAILEDIRASISVLLNPSTIAANTTIAPNTRRGSIITHTINGYSPKQSNGTTVASRVEVIPIALDTIRKEGRFLHKRQIEQITGLDNVSPSLSFAKARNREDLVSYVPGTTRNQTVWGFKSWFDENGKPKPEHMFDKEFVLAIK